MSYLKFEEDEELYDYYDDIDLDDLVGSNWSVDTVANALGAAGIVEKDVPSYYGEMGRLIFMHGNPNEVYSSQELGFIDSVKEVIMFPEFNKRMHDSNMACRTFSVRITETGFDAIASCIAFEKIINKAFDGFNIFCFSTEESIHFGCRLFASKEGDCTLSAAIKKEMEFEQIIDDLSFIADNDDFIDCYRQIDNIISANIEELEDYEQMILRRRALRSTYVEEIDKLAKDIGADASIEKERYWDLYCGDEKEMTFKTLLEEVEESLSFIKSTRINPYELLFEAEETEKKAEEVEKQHETIAKEINDEADDVEEDEEDLTQLLNDPEEMIKLLKKKKGI